MKKNELIIIKEGSVEILIHKKDKDSVPTKSMNVFYNKKMELNRDFTSLAINAYQNLYSENRIRLYIVDSMAASGISSIRILKECKNIKKININDIDPFAVDLIRNNLELNHLDESITEIEVSNKDANLLFLELAQKVFNESENSPIKPNVISIDPYGTPNLYLDSAFKAIKRKMGLMCITATDTAVLFGIKPEVCIRKYMAKPIHTEYCKEIGARILIYFISRIANINNLGIIPLFSLYSNHFIRIFILTFKNKERILKNILNYGFILHCKNCGHRLSISSNFLEFSYSCPICGLDKKIEYAGPLWINNLHERVFLEEVCKLNKEKKYNNKKRIHKILQCAQEEIDMPPTYYNIHKLSQKMKLSSIPKINVIVNKLKEDGYKASRTHFDFLAIKTNSSIDKLKRILQNINS
ncbi:MAG: tRNA (guanine(10)-N(2))-dimethyltransferase [Candidatus Heimdallarchaeota archaeon]